jgi:tRNA-dihydrouridine synthase C
MYHVARIKQWLGFLRKNYAQASILFDEIRTLKSSAAIASVIDRHCRLAA